jgi:hypothetical protein
VPTIDDILRLSDPTAFAIGLSNLVFPRCQRDGFQALTAAERVVYCVDELEREVNNGGFDQFFFNSSGDVAEDTVAALEAISAQKAASIVRRAMARLPGGTAPRDRNQRQQVMAQASANWEDLDEEYYSYPDDLTALLRAYVEQHRGEFRPS